MFNCRVVTSRLISKRRNGLQLEAMVCAMIWALIVTTAVSMAQLEDSATNPVIRGDHPDPSIIRVGTEYWMASTSGDWSPQFALYRSTDLKHWTSAGGVFPHQPAWAVGSFWAPELVNARGRILVYYVGRKRGGPLCVGAATATRPE